MVRANRQFFVVKIDKKLQTQKRNNLVSKNIGYLGIKHSEQEGDDKLDGVRVWDVDHESPAWNAAFKANDIIKKINDVPVKSYAEMSEQISLYAPGAEIKIHYINSFSVDQTHLSLKKVVLGERKFEIVLPPHIIDFQYNLQFGEVVEIGSIAGQQFPDAQIGDLLVFHHLVEHKPRPEGDINFNDFHLVDTDENGDEYRLVNFTTELFGVIKMDKGVIIPYKNFIFCRADIKKATIQMSPSGLWLPDAWEQTAEDIQAKIDETNAHIQEIMTSGIMKEGMNESNYKRKEEVNAMILMMKKEQRELGRKMQQKKFVELTVLFINPETCEELQTEIKAGDVLIADYNTLYPLDLFGVQYTLLRKDWVDGLISKN